MQTTKRALLSIVACALASSSAMAAPGALLVPGAEDGVAREALASVAVAGIDVATAAATIELLNAAQASGLGCVGADVACWQQLAGLGGFQTVIIVTDNSVIVATPSTTTTAPRLIAGAAGLGPAVRRAVRQRGALQLGVDVAGATVTVDGAAVTLDNGAAVVDDLSVGTHVVAVDAAGYTPLSQPIQLVGGAVERPVLALVPMQVASPSPLFIAGVGALGAGAAVAAGAIGYAGYNELQANETCHATSTGPCNEARTGWLVAIGGGVVGLVGLGLTVLALQ